MTFGFTKCLYYDNTGNSESDLKQATAYVMPLGGIGAIDIVAALNKNAKYIRGRIAPKLSLQSLLLQLSTEKIKHLSGLKDRPFTQ